MSDRLKKILYVDDEQWNLDFCTGILESAYPNYTILQALDGEEGLKIARKELPDVILLDIIMPGIDGFEMCKLLKVNPLTQHIPVVMVSAKGDETQIRIEALDSGADSIMSKPFDRMEFLGIIGVMLKNHKVNEDLKKKNLDLSQFLEEKAKENSATEERYGQISRFDEHYLWEVDENKVVKYISQGAQDILGFNVESVIGTRASEFDFFPEFTHDDSFKDVECKTVSQKGHLLWLAVSGFSVYDNNGVFIGFRGIAHNITSYKRMKLELEKKIQEIKLYRKRVFSMGNALAKTEEYERRKISEYLHDELGATLAITKMKLSSITYSNNSDEIQSIVEESLVYLDKAIQDSRSAIYELSPPILYELGLEAAIQWKLDQVSKEGKIESILRVNCDFEVVDQDFRVFVFRIISELILNVLKHANATSLEVVIDIVKGHFLIFVKDNGKGIDPDYFKLFNPKLSFGLRNMIDRIESLGGRINVESEKDEYTYIMIRIPIQKS